MLKLGKMKNPHHDAAAADVLAAFEAAQGGGLPTVECYHAAVGALASRASRSYGHLRGSAGGPDRSRHQNKSAD